MVAKVVDIDKAQKQDQKETQSVVTEMKLVTPAIADRYLRLGEYELQRSTSPIHIEELAEEMEAGRFQEGTTIDIAELGERFFLINGRHTCSAIVKSGLAQRLCVKKHRVSNEREVGAIYARLDIQKTRTPFERLRALGVADSFDLNQHEISAINGGLKLILAQFRNQPSSKIQTRSVDRAIFKSAERWAEGFDEYRHQIQQFKEAINFEEQVGERRRFLRTGVTAIALVTLRHQGKKAWDFWASAAADDGLRAHSPAHRLNMWLHVNRARSGGAALNQARYIASCWNAHYEGRQLRKVYPADSGLIGITIKGTPFKARRK